MTVRPFDTLTGRAAPLVPVTPGAIKIYVCGPTVYDDPHLGHARSAVVFDVITRYLQATGSDVTYVRNITDIDDKILSRAREQRRHFRSVADRYARRYQEAMARLNTRQPDAEPKATAYIVPIHNAIARLLHTGNAYPAGGDIYFAVTSFERYGRLSGRTIAPLGRGRKRAGDEGKRHPADFVLWKAARNGEPSWPSPWGNGRPGWHIECSAMSAHLLGDVFDIHGGGADLMFPHHENEIAQSECISGKTPAACWLHNGMVTVHGEKMSKSGNNGLNLMDLLDRHHPDALRLLLLSKRYRHPLAFSDEAMASAAGSAARLHRWFAHPAMPAASADAPGFLKSALWARFCSAMDDDFNFPLALSVVFGGLKDIHRYWRQPSSEVPRWRKEAAAAVILDLFFICRKILGLEPVADRRWLPVMQQSACMGAPV